MSDDILSLADCKDGLPTTSEAVVLCGERRPFPRRGTW